MTGPEIDAGTWLIFINASENSNKWGITGVQVTGALNVVFANTSHNGCVSNSGSYTGEATQLKAALYNGNAESRNYTLNFKAIKISDTYQK